ncbi:MAG: aminotransferase class I/II-fold pyridoxal phosphate-dependent enzyme [Proteobacteria bacterium]|nr:aminotransferase class I/II-fold pyridoxal phosphate-dependent enzyme [Pseudomonadota bacterium]
MAKHAAIPLSEATEHPSGTNPANHKIPLAEPDLSGKEAAYLSECVASGYVSSVGPFVERFEGAIARATGARHAVATSSGTAGLHVALDAVGVGRDDLVIIPSYTFVATAAAVAYCGAVPWLFDISEGSWTLDPHQLSTHLNRDTEFVRGALVHIASGRRIGAIMPVYTLGLPANMEAIVEVAGKYGLPVVADAAAALGARFRGHPLASSGATLTVISFNGNKTVTAGGGGAVVGNDATLMDLVRHLSATARRGEGYDHDRVGYNYRLTNLQAAVGCAQLERLDALLERKRQIRARYVDGLGDVAAISPSPSPDWAQSSCWLSVFALLGGGRDDAASLRQSMNAAGIEARPFWKPMHLQAPYREAPRTALPVSESIWQRVLPLPSSPQLTPREQSRVIDAVRRGLANL